MLEKLFGIFFKLYHIKILISFMGIFLLAQIPTFHIVPDFFNFRNVQSGETYYLTLLSIIIGSSSIILTILLVVYSSFSKKIKRNSIDFILENYWIKLAFSIFIGSLLFVSFSLLILNKSNANTNITLLYISSFITLFSIVIQFPLILLSLKHSNSYDQISQLINSINQSDINNIYDPSKINSETKIIDNLEKNRIIQLKDIGVFAIKEADWSLPQSILNDLYEKLIIPLNQETEKSIFIKNVYAFSFVCNHFKNIVIEESDYVTIKVLLNNLYRTHIHFAKNNIRILRGNPIDENIKDIFRLIVENNNFYNIQPYLLRNAIEIIKEHIKSTKYTDKELPTLDYNFSNLKEEQIERSELIRDYWFYLTHELPDLFFNVLEHSIEIGNKNVYSRFDWQLNSIMRIIYNSESLTEHQKNDIFDDYFYKSKSITDFAIKKNIYEGIYPVSDIQIEQWIVNNRKKGIRALYDFYFFLGKLNDLNKLTRIYIDDFFMIARKLSNRKMNVNLKIQAFEIILESGFSLYKNETSSQQVKSEIVRQLKWLNGYLEENEELIKLKEKFSSKIKEI